MTQSERDTVPEGYEPVAYVAQGTFSEIWQVRDVQTGRPYALKRLRGEWSDHPAGRRLLCNEAHVTRAVCSPHVIRVLQSDWTGPHPYTLLEWMEGATLDEKLANAGPMNLPEAVWIVRQCAQALSHLAEAGFSHGDVKPANVFVAENGEVKLIDLGFARPIRPLGSPESRVQNPETESRARPNPDARHWVLDSSLTGTAEYMAPELLSRGRFSPVAGDMYSLGITLYQMLAGRLPFVGRTAASVLRLQRAAKPPPLERWCPDAPGQLIHLVDRLLAKQPLRRPHSLAVLIHELVRLELSTWPTAGEGQLTG